MIWVRYMDKNDFYNSILHLSSTNIGDIEQIIKTEKSKILDITQDLSGLCKYIANNIEIDLNKIGVTTYYLDLNNIIDVDHVSLIAEYKNNNQINQILIDPTYQQFTKNDNKLLKFKEWPSEKLDKNTLDSLLTKGYVSLNNEIFNNYLNSFTENKIQYNLEDFLLKDRLKKVR